MGLTYSDSGVDIDRTNEAKRRLAEHVKKTLTKDVMLGFGSFGSAFSAKKLKKYKDPVLVSSIDGVGTKLKVAAMAEKWDIVGKDLVHHSINDILCSGAEPLFFLDYIAASQINPHNVEQIVKGMAEACKEFGIALVGGETAEMPGIYKEGEYDLAGCIIGIAEKKDLITGKKIKKNDVLISLPSTGLHTNGYSLARKVLFEEAAFSTGHYSDELGCTVGEALMAVHRPYLNEIKKLKKNKIQINGLAHITGGGLLENIPRILPKGLGVEIQKNKINVLPIFKLIQHRGNVPEQDMWRTFNMGVGMVIVVPKNQAEKALQILGKEAKQIGQVVKGEGVYLLD